MAPTLARPVSSAFAADFRDRVVVVTGASAGIGRATALAETAADAYRGIPLQSAYRAAKHAIRGFTGSSRSFSVVGLADR